jgi:hypothetical protein
MATSSNSPWTPRHSAWSEWAAGEHLCGPFFDIDLRQERENGACGHNGWHLVRTLLPFSVEAAKISCGQAIELGSRGRRQTVGNRHSRE